MKTSESLNCVLVKDFPFAAEGQICRLRCSPPWVFASVLGCSPVSWGAAYRPSNIPIPDHTRLGAFTSAILFVSLGVCRCEIFELDVLIPYAFRSGSRILCTLFTAFVSGLVVEWRSPTNPLVLLIPRSCGQVFPSPLPPRRPLHTWLLVLFTYISFTMKISIFNMLVGCKVTIIGNCICLISLASHQPLSSYTLSHSMACYRPGWEILLEST